MKTKSEHTPGPWECDNSDTPCVFPKTDDGQGIIADVYRGDRAMANARLIAAAPDLLEACQNALALIVNGPDGCDDDPKRIIAEIRSAIQKATET